MPTYVAELLHLIARWVHLIAGIMWIGNSMLFNWLDRNLEAPPKDKPLSVGSIWMVHSGGFYQVEKTFLAPGQMPKTLHWFKWQNGITWLSGISLLVLVYYLGGAALMTDPSVAGISSSQAVAVGVGTLVLGWVAYDRIWRSSLGKNATLGFALSLLTVLALSFVQFRFLSGRAAYMHVGVMLGTIMTGNVWFVIIPSQRELIAATNEGRAQDPAFGYQAKQRSIHNNYITFPLLFIMLSNHFPSTFGHVWNWVVLLVLSIGSAAIRHLMNIRFTYPRWLVPAGATFVASCLLLLVLFAHPDGVFRPSAPRSGVALSHVTYSEVEPVVKARCVPCHSAHPTNDAFRIAPNGVKFDTVMELRAHAEQVKLRTTTLRTMPLGNMTNISEDERLLIGAWVDQGAEGGR